MQQRSTEEVDGWLIAPDGQYCVRFHRDPKSWMRYPFVFIDKWHSVEGTPSQMKYRRKLPLDDALELSAQMLSDGWEKLHEQFGEGGEPAFDEIPA